MPITYNEALEIVLQTAQESMHGCGDQFEEVSLEDAAGRIAGRHQTSPVTTPPFDTSAMDGYAVCSEALREASIENPVTFVVKCTIAAGDEPISLPNEPSNGVYPCVEIMTGAQFPRSVSGKPFDACVKIEDTVRQLKCRRDSEQYIVIKRPIPGNANRRFAGEDFQKGDILLEKGDVVRPHHIMGMASVGVSQVTVCRRPRVAIWSTGKEVTSPNGEYKSCIKIRDANGPYLLAAIREMGADADFLGTLDDNEQILREEIRTNVEENRYDLIVTTGAVSKGKFDFILPALKAIGAEIRFHGVAMRPGHPVILATIPSEHGNIPFFGLPGNPVATAACFRFLVTPFIRYSLGGTQESPKNAKMELRNGMRKAVALLPAHLDHFRHGKLRITSDGGAQVELSQEQSPAKISYFSSSNCWVHIPRGYSTETEDVIYQCFPH